MGPTRRRHPREISRPLASRTHPLVPPPAEPHPHPTLPPGAVPPSGEAFPCPPSSAPPSTAGTPASGSASPGPASAVRHRPCQHCPPSQELPSASIGYRHPPCPSQAWARHSGAAAQATGPEGTHRSCSQVPRTQVSGTTHSPPSGTSKRTHWPLGTSQYEKGTHGLCGHSRHSVTQRPSRQPPSTAQPLPGSVHGVPASAKTSSGHAGLWPSQNSAWSQVSSRGGRQRLPASRSSSGGQALEAPLQVPARSHRSEAARHTVPGA